MLFLVASGSERARLVSGLPCLVFHSGRREVTFALFQQRLFPEKYPDALAAWAEITTWIKGSKAALDAGEALSEEQSTQPPLCTSAEWIGKRACRAFFCLRGSWPG